jgi:hypothetical protein
MWVPSDPKQMGPVPVGECSGIGISRRDCRAPGWRLRAGGERRGCPGSEDRRRRLQSAGEGGPRHSAALERWFGPPVQPRGKVCEVTFPNQTFTKSIVVFWAMALCGLVSGYQGVGRTCRQLEGDFLRKTSYSIRQQSTYSPPRTSTFRVCALRFIDLQVQPI